MSISRKRSIKLSTSPYLESRNSSILTSPIYRLSFKTNSHVSKSRKNFSLSKNEILDTDNCSKIFKSSPTKQFKIRNPAIQQCKQDFYNSNKRKYYQDIENRIMDFKIWGQNFEFSFDVFESIQEIFEYLIRNSDVNKEIFLKIKEIYESWIKAAYKKKNENQECYYEEINNKLKKEISKNEVFLKEIKRLSEENAEFGKEKELAKCEFNQIIENFEDNNKSKFQGISDENKSKLILGAKNFIEQSYSEILENLKFCKLIEKTVYKIFNLFVKKNYPIEQILKRINNIDIYERWKYYNQNLSLKPFGIMEKLINKSERVLGC